jgi:hypothetical protein
MIGPVYLCAVHGLLFSEQLINADSRERALRLKQLAKVSRTLILSSHFLSSWKYLPKMCGERPRRLAVLPAGWYSPRSPDEVTWAERCLDVRTGGESRCGLNGRARFVSATETSNEQ